MNTEVLISDTLSVRELAKMLGAHESRLLDAVKEGRLVTVDDPHRILIERGDGSSYYVERMERGSLLVTRAAVSAFLASEGTEADLASPAGKWVAEAA